MIRIGWGQSYVFAMLAAWVCMTGQAQANTPVKIVLIGGQKSHGIGEHDFPAGIAVIEELLRASPQFKGKQILAYPNGWPLDTTDLDGAATVLLYFDGVMGGDETHPLFNNEHRAQFEKWMRHGTGLIALHQASTVPANDSHINLPRWLGGARYGMVDRTTELVLFKPNHASPVSRGVGQFSLLDEYYPTLQFVTDSRSITPVLVGKLHPQSRDGHPLIIDKAQTSLVAWTFERSDGGRAFAFTGLHFLSGLDEAPVRKMLLNAIAWTARIEVPADGVSTSAPLNVALTSIKNETDGAAPTKKIAEAVVTTAAQSQVIQYPWGQLTWYVSGELKNSDVLTVGQAIIKPGAHNPRHYHPNCDEVLHVLKGHILNHVGDKATEMVAGDTVSIPMGQRHFAQNIGTEDAVLSISYNTADRQVVGE